MDDSIDAIFFDLDDTLFDATGLAEKARHAAIEAMIEKGLEGVTADSGYEILKEIVDEFGSNADNHFNLLLKRLDQPSVKLVSIAVITYHTIKVKDIKLFPDVFGFLLDIKNETGCRLGIITDGLAIKQYEKILRLGLDPFFPDVFISDEIGIRKPNPKLFTWALEKTEVAPARSLYVGDRFDYDIVPAKRACMKTCLVHRGGKHDKPIDDTSKKLIDFEVRDLGELWKSIQGVLKPRA
ncbi:MAG: TIGR02253 family HAD-type hydrolase [Candidatus Lokiarchaeota archaeon]|nr:TIGR02253 family HAD-type hydrolase [Candidatus Lokiarchaeota archaeon]